MRLAAVTTGVRRVEMIMGRRRNLGGGWYGQSAFWRWIAVAVVLGALAGIAWAYAEGNLPL